MSAPHHNRVSPAGQELGEKMSRLTDMEVLRLVVMGEWDTDERCASCAFRSGTVPNGCLQTQLDALKCVLEKKTFSCHVPGNSPGDVCMGWFAAMQSRGAAKRPAIPCPWPFSPDDTEEQPTSTR